MKVFKPLRLKRPAMLILLGVMIMLTLIVWFSLRFAGNNRKITGLDIRIKPDSGVYFLSIQDVSDLITKTTGNPIGKSLRDVDISNVEFALRKLPHISEAQAFVSMDGKFRIRITQRIPILMVQNSFHESFYIDSTGIKIPMRGMRMPDVLIASGNIPEKLSDSSHIHTPAMLHLIRIAKFIASDPFWDRQFEQCYVDNLGDIILVPRSGKHSIVLGTADNLKKKMENLRIFYEKALPNIGWEQYSVISLKYAGQIVGVRSGKETAHKEPKNVQNPKH